MINPASFLFKSLNSIFPISFLILVLFNQNLLAQLDPTEVDVSYVECTGEVIVEFLLEQSAGANNCSDVDKIFSLEVFYEDGSTEVPIMYLLWNGTKTLLDPIAAIYSGTTEYPHLYTAFTEDAATRNVNLSNPDWPFSRCANYGYILADGATFISDIRGNNAELRFFRLPPKFNQNARIKIKGQWVAPGPTGIYTSPVPFFSATKTLNLPATGTATKFTSLGASNNSCDQINLTWSALSSISTCTDKRFIDIERSLAGQNNYTEFATGLPFTTISDIDLIDDKTNSFDYRIRHRFEPNVARVFVSDWTETSMAGKRVGSVPAPIDVTSELKSCEDFIKVQWQYNGNTTDLNYFQMERREVGQPWDTLTNTISSSARSYEDQSAQVNTIYEYRVLSLNKCIPADISVPSVTVTGSIAGKPSAPINVSSATGTDQIIISWDPVNSQFVDGYRILREGDGSLVEFNNLDLSPTTYIDNNVQSCIKYTYTVKATSECSSQGVGTDTTQVKISPILTNAFQGNNAFEASKGYFSDRIELRWFNTEDQNTTQTEIFRRQLNTTDTFALYTTKPSGSGLYIDQNSVAGVFYEYKIRGIQQCDGSINTTNEVTSVGFRQKSGQVAGSVSFNDGVAVPDVKIIGEPTSGYIAGGLDISGGIVAIPHVPAQRPDNELVLETWMRPDLYSNKSFPIIKSGGVYDLSYDHTNSTFNFIVTSTSQSHTISVHRDSFPSGEWHHIAAQLYQDSLFIYKNGNIVSKGYTQNNFDFGTPVGDSIRILDQFDGQVTEMRAWRRGRPHLEMFRDHSRHVVGNEADLIFYLPFTEGGGSYAYDRSRQNVNDFNKNHAKIAGAFAWISATSSLPDIDRLNFAAYTDDQGLYLMNLPFGNTGTNYRLSPSYLTHEFNPKRELLLIGDGSSVINGVDFIDISTFRVTGFVKFKGTICPVEGAFVKRNGEILRNLEGNPVLTDSKGEFDIQVPIGKHVLTVEKGGHVFSRGRFPADPNVESFDFLKPETGIPFYDSTTVTIIGRVAGGLREATKPIGFGKSKNNIGQGVVTFAEVGGCKTYMATTVDTSGEYLIQIPPLKYTTSARVAGNDIDFPSALQTYDDPAISRIERDSIFDQNSLPTDSDRLLVRVDSIIYNHRLDYIYKADLKNKDEFKIVVKDEHGKNDFIGDTILTYTMPNGDVIERNLREDELPWPVFSEDDVSTRVGKKYNCMVKVFEMYTNRDDLTNIIRDSVPTTDGVLNITNQLADTSRHTIKLKDINTVDSLKSLIISFNVGKPNFSPNNSEPKYSYTNEFIISYSPPIGDAINWVPEHLTEANGGSIAPSDPVKTFRGYVMGSNAIGQSFFTEGPQRPEFVLRDPPGSGSSATREVGSTTSYERTWGWNLGQSAATEDNIKVGIDLQTGIGVATRTNIEVDSKTGFKAEISGGRNGGIQETTTTTRAYSTSSTTDQVGVGSDLYLGKSQNITWGETENLRIVPISICDQVNCIDTLDERHSLATTSGLALAPEGYATNFAYSQSFLLNYLIPSLKDIRTKLLTDPNGKYDIAGKIPISSELFGLNNDDPKLFHLAGYVDCQGLTPCFASMSGPSYIYNAVTEKDSLTGDSVRYINQQIRLWEEAIELNEWEKASIRDENEIKKILAEEQQKLKDEYAADIVAQSATGIVGIAALGAVTLGTILAPVPGTAIAGTITFGVTTAAGIANAETASRYEEYLLKKLRLEAKFESILRYAEEPTNFSISSGNSVSESISTSSAISSGGSIEYTITASQKFESTSALSNTGVAFEKGFETSFNYSRDWNEEEDSTQTVSFTISEDDQPDFFSVDVYPSMLGWGPIFKMRPGGQTSCPWESEVVSLFYKDSVTHQSVVLSSATKQIDKPIIKSVFPSPSIIKAVPAKSKASFVLTLKNESEAFAAREYRLETSARSNPYGAIIRYDGSAGAGQTIAFGGREELLKTITIEKPPGPRLEFDDLLILFYAPCQFEAGTSDNYDIVDSVYLSVHFLPDCTPVEISRPTDQWVLNNSDKDTMEVILAGYDINYGEFEKIQLDYKAIDVPGWTKLETFWVDTIGLNDPKAILIPRNTPIINWDWLTKDYQDGSYELRATSICTQASEESEIHRGYRDTEDPHAFGTPSPGDGILDPNDDILLTLNEVIAKGNIDKDANFTITGVVNGSAAGIPETSLLFDGTSSYAVIPEYQLQQRSVSVDFWVKRNRLDVEEVIISQGDINDQFKVYFDDQNLLSMRIGGPSSVIKSDEPINDTDWYHCAISFDADSTKAKIYIAHSTKPFKTPNALNTNFNSNYNATGPIYIGKDVTSGANHFSGFINDLRLWNTPLSESQVVNQRSAVLSGREAGLIGNWPINEAYGPIANDKVRSRHMALFGTTWSVFPQNNAVELDGVDDYLVADTTGRLVYGAESDITIEAWFKTNEARVQTIFSNGRSDDPTTPSAWNLYINSLGAIIVENQDTSYSTPAGYNDDKWHHVSAVMARNSATLIYIDGELVTTGNSSIFGEFSGPKIWIGCRGWIEPNQMDTTDRFWEGHLDDIRLWNLARRPEQITRDFVNQMKGDELGLKVYYPFDNIIVDGKRRERAPGLMDASKNSYHLIKGDPSQSGPTTSIAPLMNLPRLTEQINFVFSVNADKVFIDLDETADRLENVRVDITVEGLKDLAGNSMQEAVTWIAYINKNQVFWEEEYFQFETKINDNLSFKSRIKNTGGSHENFSISNLPVWLSASPSTGIIGPNSSVEITFTVQPLLNIGEYEQDIYVSTESFKFNERLLLDLKVSVDPPDWVLDEDAFPNSMNITGQLLINDVISTDPEDMVSVWVNDSLRGVSHVEYDPNSGKNLVFLTILSDSASMDPLVFKAWDASRGRLLVDIEPRNFIYTNNQILGSRTNPIDIKATVLTELTYKMNPGWNWISFPLAAQVLSNANLALEELSPSQNDKLVYPGREYTYSGNLWQGTDTLTTSRGYKIKLAKADTFRYEGTFVDPSTEPIAIVKGWNWIGVKSEFIVDVPSAMASLDPKTGDLIKGQRSFAIYEDGYGWGGNLEFLQPKQGYMLKYHTSDQLIYPGYLNARTHTETQLKSRSHRGKDYALLEKSLNYVDGKYSNTMSLIAEIDACIALNSGEAELDLSQWSLAVHGGAECRGVVESTWQSSTGKYVYYLSIEGSSSVDLNFQLVHNTNGMAISLSQTMQFASNGIVGMNSSPYQFTCGETSDCFESTLFQSGDIDMSQSEMTQHVMSDLRSDAILPSDRLYRFKAGNSIELILGFEVKDAAILEAYIEDCITTKQ